MARARLNQSELARRTDRSQPYWHRRVSGELPFDIDDLAAIATVLGIDVADFFRYNEKGPTPHENAVQARSRRPRGDSNSQPTDWASVQVTSLDEWRAKRHAA